MPQDISELPHRWSILARKKLRGICPELDRGLRDPLKAPLDRILYKLIFCELDETYAVNVPFDALCILDDVVQQTEFLVRMQRCDP